LTHQPLPLVLVGSLFPYFPTALDSIWSSGYLKPSSSLCVGFWCTSVKKSPHFFLICIFFFVWLFRPPWYSIRSTVALHCLSIDTLSMANMLSMDSDMHCGGVQGSHHKLYLSACRNVGLCHRRGKSLCRSHLLDPVVVSLLIPC
jgi:hypothetical protein